MVDLKKLTKRGLIKILEKQRGSQRDYARKYYAIPGRREARRKFMKERYHKIQAGYRAAKKAGLI